MTTHADPNRVRTDEIAALRQEVAELRRELAHVKTANARQHQTLLRVQNAVLETDKRVTIAEGATYGLLDDTKNHAAALDCYRAWAESMFREFDIWVQHLLERACPKAQTFCYTELRRVFPNGFADVPTCRLPKKNTR